MKKRGLALTAVGLTLLMQASVANAGGWHGGYGGHGNHYYSHHYGHSSNDAAIVAAALFGTAALVNAFAAPRYYSAPPPAYYPPPPPAYSPPPPAAYYPPPPVAYYPPPPVVYYPRGYYYRPH